MENAFYQIHLSIQQLKTTKIGEELLSLKYTNKVEIRWL